MREIVVFTIDIANEVMTTLDDGTLRRSILRTITLLKQDPFYGNKVRKHQIPKILQHLPNLRRAELAGYWRMLYYLASDEQYTYVIIFEICDHHRYDKIFGY